MFWIWLLKSTGEDVTFELYEPVFGLNSQESILPGEIHELINSISSLLVIIDESIAQNF